MTETNDSPFERVLNDATQWATAKSKFDPAFRVGSQIYGAINLMYQAHGAQTRKFSGVPYTTHPFEVARLTNEHFSRVCEGEKDDAICAALLHDTLEDTKISESEIRSECGVRVLRLVRELTNPSKGVKANREVRKKMDREHLKTVSRTAKMIKIIDRTVNLRDMVGADSGFRKLYAAESFALWNECLRDIDHTLERDLLEQIWLCGDVI
jgi:(p)ppGpp synthase/HD superfamily hydrolase